MTSPTQHPILKKTLTDANLAADLPIEKILRTALRNGGALAELFFEETDSSRIFFEDGKVERIVDGKDRGCGLRILYDNRSVYGYTTDLSAGALEALATTLSAAVTGKSGEKGAGSEAIEWRKTEAKSREIANYRVGKSPRSTTLAEKVALAKRANDGARGVFPKARQVTAIVLDSLRKILILNSDGLVSKDEKTYLQMAVEVVGEKDGRVESAYESDGGFVGIEFFEKNRPEDIGGEAARRAKVLLEAVPAPSGSMPVVLAAEAGGTMIHEAVGHGLEADLACNGLSVYQGKVGQMVASPLISVLDDGTMPERRGSYTFDDEGTPSQRNVLIENGVLKGYLVDRISAMKFDLPATGNGRRETFRHKPIVRMTNTYIAPGKDDPAQILRDTKWGVYVKSMGGGQVNTVTGDFVFAVTEGYLIRDGKIAEPIRGATLVGNGPKVLQIVDRLGNDLGFATGTCGKDGQGAPVTDAQPTMRIPEITVGGEVPIETYWPKGA
jgi:TldD protein